MTMPSSQSQSLQPYIAPVRMATERQVHTLREPIIKRTRWQYISVVLLLGFTAAMFFINLTASGYANEFYSAAAQAGASNWEAFLWGSFDAGNSITVDKPPAALWLMALSVRAFGLNSFAILLPQALLGVASVALLYAAVRRYWGHYAGLIAGFTLATTPVAVLMFRFNNPDALLVFLEIATIYAVGRALEYANTKSGNRHRTWWMILAGAAVGFGFLNKQLQVMLILPGCAIAFLVASPTGWGRRILDGLAAIVSMLVSAGWWVALTVLVPADKRPYIGGSQTNSFLELTFGYNGLGRLTGNESGSVVPGGGASKGAMGAYASGSGNAVSGTGAYASDGSAAMGGMTGGGTMPNIEGMANGAAPAGGFIDGGMGGAMGGAGKSGGMWGQTGITRLFTDSFASQISWLALLGFIGIILGFVIARHTLRTDLRRASTLLWGSWLVVTWLVFSFMAGIFHQYYTVALAPALAALVAIACTVLWQRRSTFWTRIVAAVIVAFSTVWAVYVISSSSWLPWLKLVVGIVGGVGTLGLLLLALVAYPSRKFASWRTPAHVGMVRILAWVSIALSAIALYAGPVAWSAYTVSTGHHGSIVTAGPQSAGGMGGGARGAGFGRSQGGSPNGMQGGANNGAQLGGNQTNQQGNTQQDGNTGMQPPQMPMQQGTQQGSQQGLQGQSGQNMPNNMPNNSPQFHDSAQLDGSSQQPDGNAQQSTGNSDDNGSSQGFQGGPMDNSEGMEGQRGGSSLLGGGQTSTEVVELLKKDADSYTWVAATTGSQSAAGYQLAANAAVMPIGGFNGTDPSPTLAQFKKLVKQGKIHYYIAGNDIGGKQMGGSQAASEIAQWVEENFTSQTIDGVTLYDLTQSQQQCWIQFFEKAQYGRWGIE